MKKLFYTLLAAALAGSCVHHSPTPQNEPVAVNVETVARTTAETAMPYVGVVEEEQSTMVSFTGMAVIKSMNVAEGQRVAKGQLLATIDDSQARNALAAAKSTLDRARDAEQRMRQLHDNNSLPEIKWVEVQSQVAQAQASFDICMKNLEDCRITAPCSGVVGNKIMGVGETVLPSEPVLTILSIDRVKVRISVPEKEIASIGPSTPSLITLDALPGETFQGGTVEKSVAADATTHTYNVRIRLANPGHKLLPGMVAKVALQTETDDARLTLPVKAVQQGADGRLFVWVVAEGTAHRRNVEIGQPIGNRITIESGLEESEKVIVEGYQKVSDGASVTF